MRRIATSKPRRPSPIRSGAPPRCSAPGGSPGCSAARTDPDRHGAVRPGHGAGARRGCPGAAAAFEAALALNPGDAAAAHNLDVTRRIIAYLTEARQDEDEEEGAEPPDDTVVDLTGDQGRPARIDAESQLSEDAAEDWMRGVETKPADFLKSRFAVEAAR